MRQFRRFESMLPRAPGTAVERRGRPRLRYQAEAVESVESIAEIRGLRWRKLPLNVVRFELWWRGFPVDVEAVQTSVVAELGRRLGGLGSRWKPSDDPCKLADSS